MADLIKGIDLYATLGKYKGEKDFWISLGSSKNSTKVFDIIDYYDTPWIYDRQFNEVTVSFFNNSETFTLKGMNKKVGRNDKCPCGSYLKIKKCCGK